MTTQHTQGRLTLELVESDSGTIRHLCPVDKDGLSVLTVVEHEGVKFAAVYLDDDARRLVAAWNYAAMLGMSTEELELAESPQAQQPRSTAIAECLHVLRPTVEGKFPQEQALEELVGYLSAPQAQPAVEPFGWIKSSEIESSARFGGSINLWRSQYDCDVPVFTAPQAQQPRKAVKLSDEELRDALRSCPTDTIEPLRTRWLYAKDFARAIEQAVLKANGVEQ